MESQVDPEGSGRGMKTCPSCGLSHEAESQRCACGYQWDPPGASRLWASTRLLTGIWAPFLVAGGFVAFVMLTPFYTSQTPGSARPQPDVTTSDLEQTATPMVYREGESLRVGELGYRVHRSEWRRFLPGPHDLPQSADAAYLFISIRVENHARQPRPVPAFQLIDETGREYGESEKAWPIEGSIGMIRHLNPGVQKDASLVFEVSHTHQYTLKVSGGYCSTETALIALQPPSPEPRKDASIGPLIDKRTGSPKPQPKKVSVKKPTPPEVPQAGPRRPDVSSADRSWPQACNMATYDGVRCAQAMRERATRGE